MSDDLKCPKCGAKRSVRCDGAVLAHYECGSHIDDGVISWQSDTCKIRERDATIAAARTGRDTTAQTSYTSQSSPAVPPEKEYDSPA